MRRSPKNILSFVLAAVMAAATAAADQKESRPETFKPRNFTARLIGHAHIDLAWLWRWKKRSMTSPSTHSWALWPKWTNSRPDLCPKPGGRL